MTDCGSENGIVASMQCMFHTNDQDELDGRTLIGTAHHL